MFHGRRGPGSARRAAVVCAGVLALTAGACSAGDDPGDKPTVGGVEASGKPIRIGFLDAATGPAPQPQIWPAVEMAARRVNDRLGGVDGRPLELIGCRTDGTPESSITCANKFTEAKADAVLDGFDTGAGAALPILRTARIPLISIAATNPVVSADRESFALGPDLGAFAAGALQSFKEQGFRKVAMAGPDVPQQHHFVDNYLTPIAKKLKLDLRTVYYPGGSPNMTTIAASIAESDPDVGGAVALPNEGQCRQLVQALRTQGFTKPIFAGSCANAIKQLGPGSGRVQTYAYLWPRAAEKYAPERIAKNLEQATEDLKPGENPKIGYMSYSGYGFLNDVVGILRTVEGEVNSASISVAFAKVENYQTFLGTTIRCDRTAWPNSSTCSNKILMLETGPNGETKPIGGGFLTVDASLAQHG